MFVIILILVLAACAYGLSRLSRLVAPRTNRTLRVLVSALLLPVCLFIAGFVAFVKSDLASWLAARPLSAWGNVAALLSVCIFAAWLGIRREPPDTSVIE